MSLGFFHWQSVAFFFGTYLSYNIFATFMQYYYYVWKKSDYQDWKIQRQHTKHLGDTSWWLPLLGMYPKKEKGPHHQLFCILNLLIACTCAGLTAEMCIRGKTKVYYDIEEHGWLYYFTYSTFVPLIFENVMEYYYHRAMHLPFIYKHIHKHHHYYKSPEPFDDLYVHPCDSGIYYMILYGPPYLFTIHYSSFVFYMIIMGICGMIDHCGVKLEISGIYNTVDHDTHHLKYDCNYAFPFPFMDLLHGTYRGVFFGRQIGLEIKEHKN